MAVPRNLADDNAHLDVKVCRKGLTIFYRVSGGEVKKIIPKEGNGYTIPVRGSNARL